MVIPRRKPQLIVFCLLIGFVINCLIAQAFGWWGKVGPTKPSTIWVRSPDGLVRVNDRKGPGKRTMIISCFEEPIGEMRMKFDADRSPAGTVAVVGSGESVPYWCGAQSQTARSRDTAVRNRVHRSSALISPALDIAFGWPFLSFKLSCDPRLLPGDRTIGNDPFVTRGGTMSDPIVVRNYDGLHSLGWIPVFPGVVLGAVVWASVPFALFVLAKWLVCTYRLRKRAM